jgi:hypothetical protein
MIKTKIILSLATLTCMFLQAQTLIIPRLGLTYSKISHTSETQYHYWDVKNRAGFVAGLDFQFPLEKNWSFQPGLFYTQKGQKTLQEAKGVTYSYYRNEVEDYIEIPFVFRGSFGSQKVNWSPLIGFSMAYGLRGKSDSYLILDDGFGQPQRGDFVETVKFGPYKNGTPGGTIFLNKSVDFGLTTGFAVTFNKKIYVDVRYTVGFTKFEFYADDPAANRVLQLTVGVPFNIKKKERTKSQIDTEKYPIDAEKYSKWLHIGLIVGPSSTEAFGSEVDNELDPTGYGSARKPAQVKCESVSFTIPVRYDFHNLFFIESGLGNIKKGTQIKYTSFISPINTTVSYLTIPVLIGFKPLNIFVKKFPVEFSIAAGVATNIAVKTDTRWVDKSYGVPNFVKFHSPTIAGQIRGNVDIRITSRISFIANYTSFKDLTPFFTRPEANEKRTIYFKGNILSGGLMFKLANY